MSSMKCLCTGWQVFDSRAGWKFFSVYHTVHTDSGVHWTYPVAMLMLSPRQGQPGNEVTASLYLMSKNGTLFPVLLFLTQPAGVGWMWPRQCGDKINPTSSRENFHKYRVLCDHAAGLSSLNVTWWCWCCHVRLCAHWLTLFAKEITKLLRWE
jgi:hypothetical protein